MLGRYVRNFSILFAAFSMVLAFQSSVMAQGGANGGGNGGGNAGGNAGWQRSREREVSKSMPTVSS